MYNQELVGASSLVRSGNRLQSQSLDFGTGFRHANTQDNNKKSLNPSQRVHSTRKMKMKMKMRMIG